MRTSLIESVHLAGFVTAAVRHVGHSSRFPSPRVPVDHEHVVGF
ncbi:hypothetical protein C791_1936 [Amycolatopsis azurea DSM 43854]|uniref:Uncharacterized protein n=1 Tax=Amycolatopsis azurea DSM 43854 TaxID=1238180 RepID=M2Q6N2_9PSEU|nr:hypothetical protein C791_1936 [Amycolatopsis azurea DSM 43854]